MLHRLTENDRRLTLDERRFVQGGINLDEVEVSLEEGGAFAECDTILLTMERDGMAPVPVRLDTMRVAVPASLMDVPGTLRFSLTGYVGDEVRATTERMRADKCGRVVPSGIIGGGPAPQDAAPDLWKQLMDEVAAATVGAEETLEKAESAAKRAEGAASDAIAASSSAAGSESKASTSAQSAADSAAAAADSAKSADDSATEAASSATGASQSATEAKASADSASQSASSASDDARTASQSASTAASAASSAGKAASTAQSAAGASQTAATSAQDDASTAQTAAETATTQAQAASASATAAQQSAKEAESSASSASQSASSASTSASQADESASRASGFASTASQAATTATGAASNASASAAAASASAESAASSAASVADKFITSAEATTLPSGSQATAEVVDQVLKLGIPQGPKGDVAEAPAYDAEKGYYTGLEGMFAARRDFRRFGVRIPYDGGTACTKLYDNAGVENPVPSTLAAPGSDPYTAFNLFFHRDCTGYPDAGGIQRVTSIEGVDGRFARDGSAGAVCVMVPAIWWSLTSADGYGELVLSNTPLQGLDILPEFLNPDGSCRQFALIPKYALVEAAGKLTSASGLQPVTRTVSHNSLITMLAALNDEDGTAWTGKDRLAHWYVAVMFLMKYANRDCQSVMRGCTQYDYHYQTIGSADAVDHVDVQKSHQLVEGSSLMIGSENVDRNLAAAHDLVDWCRIVSIDKSADGYDRLMLDRAVTVPEGSWAHTAPWATGACDGVVGDGSPSSNTAGKEPFVIQGIECMLGMYEFMSGVALRNDGSSGWRVCVHEGYPDTTDMSQYEDTGVVLPTGEADGSHYPLNMVSARGILVGTDDGGSTTTGLCDTHWTSALATVGDREFLSLGNLGSWGIAGPFCVNGGNWIGNAYWSIGSRLSATGLHGGEAA